MIRKLASGKYRLGLVDAADAAADAAGKSPADPAHQRRVLATPARGIEVDQLHPRKR